MGKGHDAGGGVLKTEPAGKDTDRFERAEQSVSELETLLGRMKQIPGMVDKSFEDWEAALQDIPERIRSGLIRIAVVGAIKSGKSTLINSMAGADFLKRGAGVTTSIVTRIQKDDTLSAQIRLKSFDRINSQIKRALDLLSGTGFDAPEWFDLRKKKDREYLFEINEHRLSDLSYEDSAVRTEKRILENALQGYDEIRDVVESDENVIEFSADRFDEHKRFTGDPAVAFFVRDVKLMNNSPGIKEGVELADCQGADSTDPAHLSQILKYLGTANMIVYVISSRTGVREADVKFLTLVRDMGLIENILFVVNCDLSEHQDFEDFIELENKIRSDLSFCKKDATLYCFSCLFNLFEEMEETLLPKDADRLRQWRRDTAFTDYTRRMSDRFRHTLERMIEHDRYHLLLFNHVERLNLIAENAKERIELFSDLLGEDTQKAENAMGNLKEAREKSLRLELMFQNSIAGVGDGLKKDIEENLEFHFKKSDESFAHELSRFVENRAPDYALYRPKIESNGFSPALHLFFLDAVKALDRFAAENITPKVVTLVRQQEKHITDHFRSLYHSCIVTPESLSDQKEEMPGPKPAESSQEEDGDTLLKDPVDLETVKRIAGIELPDLTLEVRYSGRIRTESLAGFGIHSMLWVFGKLLNKNETRSMEKGFNRACGRMKKEILAESLKSLSTYESVLKNQYFYPLIEASFRSFTDVLSERFRAGGIQIENMEEAVRKEKSEKQEQKALLETLEKDMDDLLDQIDRIM